MRAFCLILTVCFTTLILGACSAKESDLIADAQSCLDSATPLTAQSCVSKVDGLTSKGSYLIRCVGKFVEEGFNDSTRMSTAMQQINGGAGANQSLAMMTVLAFKSSGTMSINQTNAQLTLDYCNQSSSKGLILLSALSQTATTVAALGGLSNTFTATDLDNAMNAMQGNPAAQSAVGSAAVAAYNSNCQNGADSTGDFCTQFGAAITANGGDTSAIGGFLMNCYANPATPGCTGF